MDVMWPAKKLVKALDDFRKHYPTVGLRLRVEALGAVTQAVMEGAAIFWRQWSAGTRQRSSGARTGGSVKLVAVAAPDHPLAQLGVPVSAALARDHIQLVLTDRSSLTENRDFGVVSVKTWRLADMGAKHALLLAGMGWGNMPKPMVNDDLKRGRLVELQIETPSEMVYPFHTVYRSDIPPRSRRILADGAAGAFHPIDASKENARGTNAALAHWREDA